MKYQRRG